MRNPYGYRLTICQLLAFLFSLVININTHAAGTDPPHDGSNAVGCLSCHQMSSTYPKLLPPLNHTPLAGDIDDTTGNNVCWSCHNGTDAPLKTTHSSKQTDNGYGNWTVECWVCHNQHLQEQNRYNGSTYGKFIRRSVNLALIKDGNGNPIPGKSGSKSVVLMGQTGANSFADGNPAAIDGICEVCHTRTNHFRNDGLGPDQLHDNIASGQAGTNCITCHNHSNGFAHGKGGSGCEACHGTDPKHQVHLVLTGDCGTCHNVFNFPAFKDYKNLADTTVCAHCHKNGAGGGPLVPESVYKEGWHDDLFALDCSGCHGYPPAYGNGSPKINSHTRHQTYGIGCAQCHWATTSNGTAITGTALHINDVRDITFADAGMSYNTTTHTCTNTYCHSNGITVEGRTAASTSQPPALTYPRSIPANTSAAWGNGPLTCNSCHRNPPDYVDSQSSLYQYKANHHTTSHDIFTCNVCHYATTANGTTITNTNYHVNGKYDVIGDTSGSLGGTININYAYDAGGGNCSNIQCHNTGYHYAPATYRWGYNVLSPGMAFYPGSNNQYIFAYSISDKWGDLAPPITFHINYGDGTSGTVTGRRNLNVFYYDTPYSLHTYPSAGTRTFTVWARDAHNHRSINSYSNTATASSGCGSNTRVATNHSHSINGWTITITDLSVDGDYNLCGNSGNGKIYIEWGDGTNETRWVALTDQPSNEVITHTYSTPAVYTIRYEVYDNYAVAHTGNPAMRKDLPEISIPLPPNPPAQVDEPDSTSTSVTLQWNPVTSPDGDAVNYSVQVDDVPDFSSVNYSSGWISATSWTTSVVYRKWYWRVKARDGVHTNAESGWSDVDQFKISVP